MNVEQIERELQRTGRTRAEWRAFSEQVRTCTRISLEHLVRWNLSWCDRLDIAIMLAPEAA